MRIQLFDTETAGLDDPAVMQLASLILHTDDKINFREIGVFNVLIKDGYESVHPKAQKIHGISKEFAGENGITLRSAYALFGIYAKEADLIVAHNFDFDAKAIARTAKHLEIVNVLDGKKSMCTMKTTTDFCKIPGQYGKFKWPRLQELHQQLFKVDFESAHDALADVRAMARCFIELVKIGHIKL